MRFAEQCRGPPLLENRRCSAFAPAAVDLVPPIEVEHNAVATALQSAFAHVIAAGELLIAAKRKVERGQWLKWLEVISPSEAAVELIRKLQLPELALVTAMTTMLKALGYGAVATPHGLRSSFRDWGPSARTSPAKFSSTHWRTPSARNQSAPMRARSCSTSAAS
jgi:hypothetical protein